MRNDYRWSTRGGEPRPQPKLSRGADGRLKPVGPQEDVGDIWAEQRRIRLKEAILEDERKAQRKQARKHFIGRLVSGLPGHRPKAELATRKEVVLELGLPNLRLSGFLKRLSKKQLIVAAAIVAIGVSALYGAILLFGRHDGSTVAKSEKNNAAVLDQTVQQPEYDTLLPAGKSIEELGGWHRISPPGKEPVFAFVDTMNGIQINVSEQLLPGSFKNDPMAHLATLAEGFNANQTITVDKTKAYIGISEDGPQSVLLIKSNLLILIKSSQKIADEQWVGYISGLQ